MTEYYIEHPKEIKKILVIYTINKSQFDRGERSYQSVIDEVESNDGVATSDIG